MKNLLLISRRGRNLKEMLASTVVALLLVVGLFLVSALLPPLDAPVHVLNAPSVAASQASNSKGVNGTLASFTALFPEMVSVNLYLPIMMR